MQPFDAFVLITAAVLFGYVLLKSAWDWLMAPVERDDIYDSSSEAGFFGEQR